METALAIIVVTVLVALGTWLRRRQVLRFMEYGRTEEEGVFHGEDYDPQDVTLGAGSGGRGNGPSAAAGPSEISIAAPKQEG